MRVGVVEKLAVRVLTLRAAVIPENCLGLMVFRVDCMLAEGNFIGIPLCRLGGGLFLHMSKGKLFLVHGQLLNSHVG